MNYIYTAITLIGVILLSPQITEAQLRTMMDRSCNGQQNEAQRAMLGRLPSSAQQLYRGSIEILEENMKEVFAKTDEVEERRLQIAVNHARALENESPWLQGKHDDPNYKALLRRRLRQDPMYDQAWAASLRAVDELHEMEQEIAEQRYQVPLEWERHQQRVLETSTDLASSEGYSSVQIAVVQENRALRELFAIQSTLDRAVAAPLTDYGDRYTATLADKYFDTSGDSVDIGIPNTRKAIRKIEAARLRGMLIIGHLGQDETLGNASDRAALMESSTSNRTKREASRMTGKALSRLSIGRHASKQISRYKPPLLPKLAGLNATTKDKKLTDYYKRASKKMENGVKTFYKLIP